MTIDFKELNAKLLGDAPSLLASWLPGGSIKRGKEFLAKNPMRSDSKAGSFSINIKNGVWTDFAMPGVGGGDLVSLYAYLFTGDNQKKAAEELLSDTSRHGSIQITPPKEPEFKTIIPAKNPSAFDLKLKTNENGVWINKDPVRKHAYYTRQGDLRGYVCVYMGDDGVKEPRAHTYVEDSDGNRKWKTCYPEKPYPMYGMQLLDNHPNAIVVLSESEKDADRYNENADLDKVLAMSWLGSASNYNNTDFSPIYGRRVVIWPHNDLAGFEGAEGVYHKINDKLKFCKFLIPPPDKKKGWDCADFIEECEGLDIKAELAKFMGLRSKGYHEFTIASKVFPAKPIEEPEETKAEYDLMLLQKEASMEDLTDGHVVDEPIQKPEPLDPTADLPFRMLGFEGDSYYYFPKAQKQIIPISGGLHGGSKMFTLAPLQWWEQYFPKGGKSIGVDWMSASSWLISFQQRIGPYNPEHQRGFGCWIDECPETKTERVVYHLGNQIWCEGKLHGLSSFKSKYIYEWSRYSEKFEDDPLDDDGAGKLLEICDLLPLKNPIHKFYLAGWIVDAIICGALQWRPHAQVTGPAGSGKSTVMEMARKIVGPSTLNAEGSTTEAALRAQLKSDTRATIFDEFENEGRASVERIDKIFALLRQASSEGNSGIIKGTASGKSIIYKARTAALLSGITVNIEKAADTGRIAVIELESQTSVGIEKKVKLKSNWNLLEPLMYKTLTDKWCKKFRARAIKNIPVIRKSSVVFSDLIAENPDYGTKRLGDQIGTLFAGAYSLTTGKVVTRKQAKEFLDMHKFEEVMVAKFQDNKPDEIQLVQTLLETLIPWNGSDKRTILWLYNVLSGKVSRSELMNSDQQDQFLIRSARDALNRYGIDVIGATKKDSGLFISDTNIEFQKLIVETRFSRGWGPILQRIVGVKRIKHRFDRNQRFGSLISDETLGLTEGDK